MMGRYLYFCIIYLRFVFVMYLDEKYGCIANAAQIEIFRGPLWVEQITWNLPWLSGFNMFNLFNLYCNIIGVPVYYCVIIL